MVLDPSLGKEGSDPQAFTQFVIAGRNLYIGRITEEKCSLPKLHGKMCDVMEELGIGTTFIEAVGMQSAEIDWFTFAASVSSNGNSKR